MPYLPKKQPKRAYLPKIKRKQGNKAYPFYNSQMWRKYSVRYRSDKMCQSCKTEIAEVTDHIIRIEADERGQPLPTSGSAWHESNHLALCHVCHNIKRGKERHGFEVEKIKTIDGYVPKDRNDIIKVLRGERIDSTGGH